VYLVLSSGLVATTQMKDFHPDLSGDDESTEFCILLNDIYEV
jgi:hypothetical protein